MIHFPNAPEPGSPPGSALLSLPPEIDDTNAAELFTRISRVTRLRGPRLRVLILDLTATHFMDSQGVRLVSDLRHQLHPRARVRVVAPPDGMASRVLQLTGLRRDVPVYDNLAEALAA
ncbi:STAS domain-containing protein [Streptomyces sp. DH24]|uniref:STAS domain-containing protein n=1 Tax=Streptomyces sp. DH24 TaxID=3040123 RepID=UPI00244203C8|nr:STAS domain-containing protein [Streptomyces sp. DH24]MDG9720617.1 STAS domain-containing protein [Streptomyces sp. DH24]